MNTSMTGWLLVRLIVLRQIGQTISSSFGRGMGVSSTSEVVSIGARSLVDLACVERLASLVGCRPLAGFRAELGELALTSRETLLSWCEYFSSELVSIGVAVAEVDVRAVTNA